MEITWRSHNYFCFLVLLLCTSLLLLVVVAVPTSSSSLDHDHVALFIFGDSLYDVGNNNYLKKTGGQVNVWPYGETFFKHPTGRASNGRLIPDFIAEFAKLPFLLPYLQPDNYEFINGVNFASGGAGALVETHQGSVIDLKTQISYFKDVEKKLRLKLGDSKAKKLLSSAVYMFSIGGNDYLVPFTSNSTMLQSYSTKEYVKMVVGNVTTMIQEIYKSGGRKFGVLKLGAVVGCLPSLRALKLATTGGSGCMDQASALGVLHDKALSKALKELERRLPGFMYSSFDLTAAAKERTENPSKFGFKEVEKACCGSGPYRGAYTCGSKTAGYQLCDDVREYFFFDGVHPTEKVYSQLAEIMWSGSPHFVGPYNLKTLFEKY